MNKPTKLAFSDEATFSFVRGEILVPLLIAPAGFIAALVPGDVTLSELALPCAAVSAGWLGWIGLLGVITWGHRVGERREINRMFSGEIWECWQFRPSEWQALVEAESNLIGPKGEGLEAYVGGVYSGIFGVIFAVILIAVGLFVVDDPDVKNVFIILAPAVFLLLLGVGLFQPVMARYQAYRYRRKALSVSAPHVWFAADGIYHETLGHTSLKELEKVTDQTRSRKAILFTLTLTTDTSDSSVAYPFPVPSGCEARAGRLVRRYREERLAFGLAFG